MNKVKAISPKLIVHYLEINPDDRNDMRCYDNLIDRGWRVVKSDEQKLHIPIKQLYEKLL
jgi:hypothetical protein